MKEKYLETDKQGEESYKLVITWNTTVFSVKNGWGEGAETLGRQRLFQLVEGLELKVIRRHENPQWDSKS